MSSIFGGSKSSSSSQNVNNGLVTKALTPITGLAGGVSSALSPLLGGGFQGYKDQSGMNWQTGQGVEGITDNAAARGLLNSGATGKAITNYGNNQANSFYQNYLNSLLGVGGMATNAAGVVGNAGQTSQQSGSSKNGLGGLTGAALSRTAGGF